MEEEGGQEAVLGTLPMSVNQRNTRSANQRPGDIANISQSEEEIEPDYATRKLKCVSKQEIFRVKHWQRLIGLCLLVLSDVVSGNIHN